MSEPYVSERDRSFQPSETTSLNGARLGIPSICLSQPQIAILAHSIAGEVFHIKHEMVDGKHEMVFADGRREWVTPLVLEAIKMTAYLSRGYQ